MDNKNIFAENLKLQMKKNSKSRKDVCEALDFSYYTFSDWVNGKKYPRMDKVEKLAEYFGVTKSDLIEKKVTPEIKKDNGVLVKAIAQMRSDKDFLSLVDSLRTDKEFRSLVDSLHNLDAEKRKVVGEMLGLILK